MKYLSVCSGIEATTVGWHPLGWAPFAFSEIEPFPSAVLAHHYPDTPNLGDMTKFKEWPDAAINVFVGGTPCQSFSIAGLRKGLDDPRGNLMLTYLAIAAKYRPRWLVWENVPGVLSSNGGRDFAAFLRGLDELGYGWAYRVLDAQYFGVAQRRRRVFVVGHLGNYQRAAAVLFERHSLQGHPAPRREAGKDVAGGAARSVAIRGRDGIPHAELGDEVANAILTPNGGRGGVGVGVGAALVPMPHADISPAIKVRDSKGVSSDGDGDGAILVPMVAHSLRAEGFDASEDGSGRGTPLVPVLSNDPAHAVCANEQKTYTNEGSVFQLRNVVAQPVAFSCKDHGADAGEIAPTLRSMSHDGSHANGGGQMAVAAVQNQRNECRITDVIGALQAEPGVKQQAYLAIHPASAFTTKLHNTASNNAGKIFEERTPCLDANSPPPALLTAMQVRRLTPTECERLQGFKDGYTAIQWRGKPADQCPDVPRYKALGNSMAVPVMAWIGRRIAMVDSLANLDLGALVYPEKVA